MLAASRVGADDYAMQSEWGVVQRLVTSPVERFRRGGWSALGWAVRLTAAAVAAFVVASEIFPQSTPLLAPLTALLVVQLTPVSLLASGLDRVLSVVVGVSLAATFATFVDLTWWSLAILIALSIVIGQALRIGANLIEVPISAMLVLGVGSFNTDSAAWERISETLVGAAVGVASNLLFPPKIGALDAGAAIERLGHDVADLLERAGDYLAEPGSSEENLAEAAMDWLDAARRINHGIPDIGTRLLRAEESRRLNLRAAGTVDPGPGLRHGLESLEHLAVAVRSMFRSLADTASAFDGPLGRELRPMVALSLHEFAPALRAFGRLVRADAQPGRSHRTEVQELREALDGLWEAQARITDFVLHDDDPVRAELNFALMATIKRMLAELNLEERARRHNPSREPSLQRILKRGRLRPLPPRR